MLHDPSQTHEASAYLQPSCELNAMATRRKAKSALIALGQRFKNEAKKLKGRIHGNHKGRPVLSNGYDASLQLVDHIVAYHPFHDHHPPLPTSQLFTAACRFHTLILAITELRFCDHPPIALETTSAR